MLRKYLRVSQIWTIECVRDLGAVVIMQETWPVTVRFPLKNMRQINCNMRLKISAMRQAYRGGHNPKYYQKHS